MSEAPSSAAPSTVALTAIETQSSNTSTSDTSKSQTSAHQFDAKGNIVDSSDSDDGDVETETAEEIQAEKAIKEMKRKLKLKVNGKDVEREIDLNDDKYLTDMMQKAESADEKWQKSAKIEKQMQQFVKMLQDDPVGAMREFGHDMDALAEKYIENRIKELEKSPDQIDREKLQAELEAAQKKAKQYEDEKHASEKERIQSEYARNINEEITQGLAQTELPKSPYVVKRIAEMLIAGLDSGKNLQVKDVIPIVQKQVKAEIRQMFEAMPEDVIEQLLGKEVSTKLRKRRIAQSKQVQTASQVKSTGQSELNKAQADSVPEKTISARDFFKNL